MKEVTGNIWREACDAIVIPTNGDVNRHGAAVMGRGLALQAARRWPLMPKVLAEYLRAEGNHVFDVYKPRRLPTLLTFPVKQHWRERADIDLIERSAQELVAKVDRLAYRQVALPRVGCGNGSLNWADVLPILERHLDDKFILVSLPSEVHREA
ncbi:hypothetical protein LCGC14_2763320 [marine sediment metagenome]|uniref:Macro domain-containing protein n=1 Tax=marine sediment metagenome TaxID=412755 RepID=A0A0F8ZK94_9ZZZZ